MEEVQFSVLTNNNGRFIPGDRRLTIESLCADGAAELVFTVEGLELRGQFETDGAVVLVSWDEVTRQHELANEVKQAACSHARTKSIPYCNADSITWCADCGMDLDRPY